jgi:hypothetical protein
MKSTVHTPLACLCVTLAMMLCGERAIALPFTGVQTRADARFGMPGTGVHDPHTAISETGASLVLSSFAQQGVSTASADAAADLGFLHAQAFATFPEFVLGDASATANASWIDSFTINVPGHTGELAQFHAIGLIDGFLDRTGDGSAGVRIETFVNGANAGQLNATFDARGLKAAGFPLLSLPTTIAISGSFIIGTPFEVRMGLSAGVGARTGDTPGSADSFFRDTVTWGGIDSIKLLGVEVEDFSFLSLSGLDYTKAFVATEPPPAEVSEPSTTSLGFMLGVIAMGAFRYRARTR